jgi:hypothetical protein
MLFELEKGRIIPYDNMEIKREQQVGVHLAAGMCGEVAKREQLKRNDVIRNALTDRTFHEEEVMKMLTVLCSLKQTADNAKPDKIANRPKKGRPLHKCFENAYAEAKETGNRVEVGMCLPHLHGSFHLAYVHAYNRDKKTGEAYDTDENKNTNEGTKAFVIPLAQWEGMGNWGFVFYEGKVYALREVASSEAWDDPGVWSYVGDADRLIQKSRA